MKSQAGFDVSGRAHVIPPHSSFPRAEMCISQEGKSQLLRRPPNRHDEHQRDLLRQQAHPSRFPTMITRFITDVTTRFNAFSPQAKTARLFLTLLPPNARASGIRISTQLLAKASTEPSSLVVRFSMDAPVLLLAEP